MWYARACIAEQPGLKLSPLSIGAQPDAPSNTAPTARNPPIPRIRPSSVLVSAAHLRAPTKDERASPPASYTSHSAQPTASNGGRVIPKQTKGWPHAEGTEVAEELIAALSSSVTSVPSA